MRRALSKSAVLIGIVMVVLLHVVTAAAAPVAEGNNLHAGHVPQESPSPPRSQWYTSISGGRYYPAQEHWREYYGSARQSQLALELNRRWWSGLEVGVLADLSSQRGSGNLPLNGRIGGQVLYELYGLHAHLTLRYRFERLLWCEVFAGVGAGQYSYRQSVSGGDVISGRKSSTLARAGIRFAIDSLDSGSAASLNAQFGIERTALVLEARRTSAHFRWAILLCRVARLVVEDRG